MKTPAMIPGKIFFVAAFALVASARAATPPNVVVIYGEGTGWAATSVQMDDTNPASKSTAVHTPNLEHLAASGMRFVHGYAPSPRCTPSRAAMLTGRSAAALHMTFVGDGKRDAAGGEIVDNSRRSITPVANLELPASETTIAELLKQGGYATAHFGKWHLGRVDPARHGFDESDGATGNGGPDNVADPNPKQALGMTERGIDFMTRQTKAGRPFYLQLSHYPSQPGGRGQGGGDGGDRKARDAASTADIVDQTVGQLLDAIDRLGLAASTYVLFTTDHGTPGRNSPLSGGKGTVAEGGLRVPFFIRGPGVVPGSFSRTFVTQLDLFPTWAELARIQAPLPAGLEGGSLAGLLRDAGRGVVSRPREEFVVHFPHYDKDAQGPASAIFLGTMKLIRHDDTGTIQLFDLSRDIAERNDLASSKPGDTANLQQRLDAYLREVGAQMARPNPDFDPSAPAPAEERGGARRKEGKKLR
jgi:arylsulfatase A-like enzyme